MNLKYRFFSHSCLPQIWVIHKAVTNQQRFKLVYKIKARKIWESKMSRIRFWYLRVWYFFKYVPISQCHWSHIGLHVEMGYTNNNKSLFHIISCLQSFEREALIVFFISPSLRKHKTGSLAEEKGKNPVYSNHQSIFWKRAGNPVSNSLNFIDCRAWSRQWYYTFCSLTSITRVMQRCHSHLHYYTE